MIGLIQYLSRWVPNLAEVSPPIQHLRKNSVVWRWSDKEQRAFDELKRRVAESDWMIHPDFNHPFILFIGRLRPIEFLSKALSNNQLNWTVAEKELWVVVYCIRKWRLFLTNHPFRLFTDHRNLQYLFNSQTELNARMSRWCLTLQEFDFVCNPYTVTEEYILFEKPYPWVPLNTYISLNTGDTDKRIQSLESSDDGV